jgi:hypothetical protein
MTQPKGLEAEGFRFVLQDGEFGWVHPNLIKPEAVDITDLPEPAFNAFVERELLKREGHQPEGRQ